MSEYVGSYAQRLAWLTGFQDPPEPPPCCLEERRSSSTAGTPSRSVSRSARPSGATSRYRNQRFQVAQGECAERARIGYDPGCTLPNGSSRRRRTCRQGGRTGRVGRNPIDAVWADRPEPSKARLTVQPDEYAGKGSAEKRHEMADWLAKEGADAAVLAALDSIAWTFNIRGADVTHTPVALAFALVHADGTADLFVEGEKIGDDVRAHLGNGVRLHERHEFESYSEVAVGQAGRSRPGTFGRGDQSGAGGRRSLGILSRRDPAVLPKAVKNPVEVAGTKRRRRATGRLCRASSRDRGRGAEGRVDEMIAAEKLLGLRQPAASRI